MVSTPAPMPAAKRALRSMPMRAASSRRSTRTKAPLGHATGAISAFAARALAREPIVIPGDPGRTRDFVYVDDVMGALEELVRAGRWGETLAIGSGDPTPLRRAAQLVVAAAGTGVPIEEPGGDLPPGEDRSYTMERQVPALGFAGRPLEAAVSDYVDWLRRHPAAQGRARA